MGILEWLFGGWSTVSAYVWKRFVMDVATTSEGYGNSLAGFLKRPWLGCGNSLAGSWKLLGWVVEIPSLGCWHPIAGAGPPPLLWSDPALGVLSVSLERSVVLAQAG